MCNLQSGASTIWLLTVFLGIHKQSRICSSDDLTQFQYVLCQWHVVLMDTVAFEWFTASSTTAVFTPESLYPKQTHYAPLSA